jgi:hypothetical protein
MKYRLKMADVCPEKDKLTFVTGTILVFSKTEIPGTIIHRNCACRNLSHFATGL